MSVIFALLLLAAVVVAWLLVTVWSDRLDKRERTQQEFDRRHARVARDRDEELFL